GHGSRENRRGEHEIGGDDARAGQQPRLAGDLEDAGSDQDADESGVGLESPQVAAQTAERARGRARAHRHRLSPFASVCVRLRAAIVGKARRVSPPRTNERPPAFARVISSLRRLYGEPRPPAATDPFEIILLENIAYLADDA